MCGITGIFAFNQIGSFYMINLGKSMELLTHRGPDGRGTFIDDLIALGHRRLSIIDTINGRQPMHDKSNRYVIIFNGEIFNYKKIKEELIDSFNCEFDSESDTEVLLNAYIYWGADCLTKLSGFFAFAIYDKQSHEIFIARDRLGVKPLLYYRDEDKFIFASEMQALLAYNVPREIDYTSIQQYFSLGYIPEPNSIFQDVKKIEPGSYMIISKAQIISKRYYQLPGKKTSKKHADSFDTATQKVATLIDESIQDRLISDVPVGAFLSGGIDSSIVVATASKYIEKLNTYSIGYKDAAFYDETKSAELIAKTFNTNHTSIVLGQKDLADNIMSCLESMSEPFGDASSLPLYVLSKHVSSSVKVVLSGDGADELFGGYNKHKAEWLIKNPTWQIQCAKMAEPFLNLFKSSRASTGGDTIRQLKKLTQGMRLSDEERYYAWCCIYSSKEQGEILLEQAHKNPEYLRRKASILRRFNKGNYDLNDVLNTDMELVLASDMLYKVDSTSMANSLEVREPMIDYRLVDYVTSLPAAYKVNKNGTKFLLKQSFKDVLPDEILKKPKHGFDVPLTQLFSKDLKTWILNELLEESFIAKQRVFNPDYINILRARILKSDTLDDAQLWSIIVFQFWWKKFIH